LGNSLRALALLVLLSWSGAADAGLLGATVNMSAYYPTAASLYDNGGNVVVSGGVEYPAGSFSLYNNSWQIDITDTQIIITDLTSQGLPFSPATFNGWILHVVSGPDIVSATGDGASGFLPSAISVVNGDLLLNFQGITGPAGSSSIINYSTEAVSVPEPASLAVFAFGLLALGQARRHMS
jgi:hypothetical protein